MAFPPSFKSIDLPESFQEISTDELSGQWIDDPVLGKIWKSNNLKTDKFGIPERSDTSMFSINTEPMHFKAADIASKLPEPLQRIGGFLLDLPIGALDAAASIFSDPITPVTGLGAVKNFFKKPAELVREEKPHYRLNLDGTYTKSERLPELTREINDLPLNNTAKIKPIEIDDIPLSRITDEDVPVMSITPDGQLASFGPQTGSPRPSRATNPSNPVDQLWRKLTEAKKLNKDQRIKLTAERAERFGRAESSAGKGWDYLRRAKGQLAGKYSSARFEPLALDESTVNALGEIITEHPNLSITERINAGDALQKVLAGQVPQNHEIRLLNQVFGPYIPGRRSTGVLSRFADESDVFGSALNKFIPKTNKALNTFDDVSKTLLSSFDLSGFRQGLPLIHKKAFWTSIDDMIKAGVDDKFLPAMKAQIASEPEYNLFRRHGLAVTDVNSSRFFSSRSPVAQAIGKAPGIRHSQNAFDGFLLRLRFDAAKDLLSKIQKAQGASFDPEVMAKYVSDYVNTSTGHGNIKALGQYSDILGHLMFSPRFTASRWEMLNPKFYMMQPKGMRLEPLKNALSLLGVVGSANLIGNLVGGETESSALSPDFGKIQFGKTRIDPGNGFLQNIVLMYRLAKQATESSSGNVREFDGGYTSPTGLSTVMQYLENKLAPALGLTAKGLRGYDFKGEPLNMPAETAKKFVPIFLQDVGEIMSQDEDFDPKSLSAIPLDFLGLGGSQVYQ